MILSQYLKRAGLVSGSLLNGNTSVSGCGANLTALRGLPPMKLGAAGNYGSAAHEQFLEEKKTYKVTSEEQEIIDEAIAKLWKNPLVKSIMKGSVSEKKLYKKIYGVLVAYILDIHNEKQRIGADLKTTSCRTLKQFIESAKEYGYFRQAVVYVKAAKLKMFFFIAITKQKGNVQVFIFCTNDYKEDMKYAEEEIKWLMYFFKYYGKCLPKPEYLTNG